MLKVIDRLLLFIISIVSIALAVGGLVISFYPDYQMYDVLNLDDDMNKWMMVIGSIVLLLISLRLFYVSLRTGGGKPASIEQRSDYGDISISLETIENLTLKAAGRVRGVNDLKARVNVDQTGILLKVRTVVDGETSIPKITEEVQQGVKDYVEEITGLPVSSVSVYVANIIQSHTFKSRVE